MCWFVPGFFWGGMWIFPLAMFGVVLFVIYSIFGKGLQKPVWMNPNSSSGGMTELESPVEILKRRYARGEITKNEFEQMKMDLLS